MAVRTSTVSDYDEPRQTVFQRAAAGDAAAFAELVSTYDDDMARLSFVVCGDIEMAHDAVQSAWQIAWKKLGSVQGPDSVRAWLMSVAANEARRLMRRHRLRSLLEIRAAREPRSDDLHWSAEHIDLKDALDRLTPRDRQLLALRYVAGLTTPEIARHTGMSVTNVRVRIGRLLRRMKEELEHE